jgi:hypothetical protein
VFSKYVKCDTIDPNLGIVRVDRISDGETIAVVWNCKVFLCVCVFSSKKKKKQVAMHGTCLGSDNLQQTGDIMGAKKTMCFCF